MKQPCAHLPEFVRITDPELIELAIAKAEAGVPSIIGRVYESGGLDTFRVDLDGRGGCSQYSLACRIKGRRFVVISFPMDPDEPTHVYEDTRRCD